MGRQVIEYDHVAGHHRRAEHLRQVDREDVAIDGAAYGHRPLQALRRQGGDQRHVWPAVQWPPLANALPAFGAGVAAAVRQVGAGLVHKLKTSKIRSLNRFDKGLAQRFHPFGVALGGVEALFFRRQSSACTARPSADWLINSPPTAASQTRRSSKVASGLWRKQARSWAKAGPSRREAGPWPGDKPAALPCVRWRRRSLATKECETLNRAATASCLPPAWQAATTRSRKASE